MKGLSLAVEHFTLQDVLGCSLGMVAFCPFLLLPGYAVGYALDVLEFRRASWRERWLQSIALSFATTPVLVTLIARLTSLAAAGWFFLALSAAAVVLIGRELRTRAVAWPSRSTRVALWMGGAWVVIAVGSLIDIQVGEKLFQPAAAFDQCIRSAFAAAAARTGVPPANPFFYPGHSIAMRYYYYWNVVCALPVKVFGLNARLAELSSVVWSGFALAALIPLYLKHFCRESVDLTKKSLVGIALLGVTGLDIIPTIVHFITDRSFYADMEWWDGAQVTSWADSLLWVPHHVGAIVACLTGFLVLWNLSSESTKRMRLKVVLVAGLAFASAAGLSVYITFTFAIFLITWTLALLRSKQYAEVLTFAAAGVLAVLVSVGYLHDLIQPGYTVGAFATFYVRTLESLEDWVDARVDYEWLQQVILVLLLPVYYLVELGFFALVGMASVVNFIRRSEPLAKWEWATLNLCGTSLLVGSFLMSTTGNNDLGYRCVLFAQFVLLLWASPFLYKWMVQGVKPRAPFRLLFHAFLWIGVLGTVYQLAELRVFNFFVDKQAYVEEAPWLPAGDTIAEDLYQVRAGYAALNRALPRDAMVQYAPSNAAYVPNVYYSLHPAVDGLGSCGTPFGGDPFVCIQYQKKILDAFNGRKAFTRGDADQLCSELQIDVLVAERSDRMWALKKSWVWTGQPLVENSYLRAVACGPNREKIEQRFGLTDAR